MSAHKFSVAIAKRDEWQERRPCRADVTSSKPWDKRILRAAIARGNTMIGQAVIVGEVVSSQAAIRTDDALDVIARSQRETEDRFDKRIDEEYVLPDFVIE
jgi:hypothetical protein